VHFNVSVTSRDLQVSSRFSSRLVRLTSRVSSRSREANISVLTIDVSCPSLPSRTKNPLNFGQILTSGGLIYPAPLPIIAKFGVLEQTNGLRLRAKFRLDRFILSPLLAKPPPQILPFFGLRHFVVSTVGGNLRKVNTGAQLQHTFPYPAVSKSFLYSNAFMAKSSAKSDVQKRDAQKNKQTN